MAEPKEKPEGIRNWIAGPDYQKCLNEYDVVFKSPGVVLEKLFSLIPVDPLSQTELFFPVFQGSDHRNYRHKGKKHDHDPDLSSVKGRKDGYDPGGIGIPVFDHMEEVGEDTKIVCELSCHQLEYMTVSPHIGILTNLHEEHLITMEH